MRRPLRLLAFLCLASAAGATVPGHLPWQRNSRKRPVGGPDTSPALSLLPEGDVALDGGAFAAVSGTVDFQRFGYSLCADSPSTARNIGYPSPCIGSRGVMLRPATTNTMLDSEALNTANWDLLGSVTTTANACTDPLGGSTAEEIVFPASTSGGSRQTRYQLRQTLPLSPWSQGAWLKRTSGTGNVYLSWYTTGGTTIGRKLCTLSSVYQWCALEGVTSTTNATYAMVGVDRNDGSQAGQATATVCVWGYSVQNAPTIHNYCRRAVPNGNLAQACKREELTTPTNRWPLASGEVSLTFTPEANFAGNTTPHVLLDSQGPSISGVMLAIADGGMLFRTNDGSSITDTASAALTWTPDTAYALRATWNSGGGVELYRDSVSVADGGSKAVPTGHRDRAWIGSAAGSPTNYARGWIKTVLVQSGTRAAVDAGIPTGAAFLLDSANADGTNNNTLDAGQGLYVWTNTGTAGDLRADGGSALFTTKFAPRMKRGVTIDGGTAVAFDGEHSQLLAADKAFNSVHQTGIFDLVVVMRRTSDLAGNLWQDSLQDGGTSGFVWQVAQGGTQRFRIFPGGGAAIADITTTNDVMPTRWTLLEARGNGTSVYLSRDGQEFESTAVDGGFTSGDAGYAPILAGVVPWGDVTRTLNADVLWIGAWQRDLSTDERAQLREYLYARFGRF